jgi:ElaB/YqjD/DUF883 family membrane-anchored ribosome-binding protein
MDANEILEKSSQTQQHNSEDLEKEASSLTDKARAVKDTARQWSRQATDSTRKAAKATDVYVHENPWPVIGCIAFGCFTLGFLLGRGRG